MTIPQRKTPWKDTRRPRMVVHEPINCPICDGGPNGHTLSCPVLGVNKPLELTATRQPIQPGEYGRVSVITYPEMPRAVFIDVSAPHVAFSADELREAAHLFNQIAETLEDATRT